MLSGKSAKSKSPAGVKPAGRESSFGLTLAILETFASAGLAVFLTFAHTRIASQVTVRLERGAKSGVRFEQRARNAVANGAGLARRTATLHVHTDVKLRARFGGDERLHDEQALRIDDEIAFH